MKLNEERRANIKEKDLLKQELVGFIFVIFYFTSMLSCMNFASHINTVENPRKCVCVPGGGGGHSFKLRFAAAIAFCGFRNCNAAT